MTGLAGKSRLRRFGEFLSSGGYSLLTRPTEPPIDFESAVMECDRCRRTFRFVHRRAVGWGFDAADVLVIHTICDLCADEFNKWYYRPPCRSAVPDTLTEAAARSLGPE